MNGNSTRLPRQLEGLTTEQQTQEGEKYNERGRKAFVSGAYAPVNIKSINTGKPEKWKTVIGQIKIREGKHNRG